MYAIQFILSVCIVQLHAFLSLLVNRLDSILFAISSICIVIIVVVIIGIINFISLDVSLRQIQFGQIQFGG